MVQVSGEEAGNGRTRRPHRKSRQGCRNCKLRRVKCDETKPKCEKCISFGVACNYNQKGSDSDLHAAHSGIVSIKRPIKSRQQQSSSSIPASFYPTSEAALRGVSGSPTCQLTHAELDRLHRFMTHSVLSVGAMRTGSIYQKVIPLLVFTHPYLMHVVQTFTAIHDRYLSSSPSTLHTTTEVYHWSRAASLFNAALSAPIRPEDRDALWGTAAFLGAIAFSSIEARCEAEAWPLAPPSRQDLEWLRMSSGKASIWALTNPFRDESLFSPLKSNPDMLYLLARTSCTGIGSLPAAFVDLCGLGEDSSCENSPYYGAVATLASFMTVDCERRNMVRFLTFVSHVDPAFIRLLERKDARALLLLSFWFAKVQGAVWWVNRRAWLECRATCLYLEQWYSEDKRLMKLLAWPKLKCGLLDVDHAKRVEVEYDWTKVLDWE